ncbi:PRC-barrel domain-containing protein [Rhizobium sp. SSA_523]|uniref:PRC-barrel domain-containing protein n=1 Tax=Rhizobium sp. SSA_523 TaxID=2952477 RepID=UPI0020903F39|nr:PRC-barrel domain-containing protein [Rhizobium sp. SSA_523]MCO5732769.1 PRC-barrel domain-containing protein [Rhizobium sp. SSA_523]WKC23613.1 PRC-barrel domain-containing protein [Rhizobium sp. SSA_523]
MTRKLIAALAFSTVLPFAAVAQTSTAPAAPAAQDAGQMTNQNNARGGVADAPRVMQDAAAGPFVEIPNQGAWRVSDLEGKAVYGADGENIGEINDVLVSQDGSVNAVIIGVGGFLGIGEKDVAVQMSALQLGPGMSEEEAKAAAAKTPAVSGETTASTSGATTATPAPGAATTAGGAGMGAAGTTTAANPNTAQPGASSQEMAANPANGDAATIGEDGLPDRIVLNVTRDQLEQAPAFEGMTPAR